MGFVMATSNFITLNLLFLAFSYLLFFIHVEHHTGTVDNRDYKCIFIFKFIQTSVRRFSGASSRLDIVFLKTFILFKL
jgi:hypothetical protein